MPAIPEDFADLFGTNVVAHVTLAKADGALVTHVMWIDSDGDQLFLGSRASSYKSRAFQRRPNVAVSVVDPANPWRRVSVSGRVTEIREDVGQAFIERLSWRYVSGPYTRTDPREIFVITPDRVRVYAGRFTAPIVTIAGDDADR